MGVDIYEHHRIINKLIEELQWYKNYMLEDFSINVDQKDNFMKRNGDLFTTFDSITEQIEKIKKAYETGDYKFSPEETKLKSIETFLMLRLSGII